MSRNQEVDITHVEKRGDWYVVKGVAKGEHGSVEIPAHAIEGKSKEEAAKLMKRGVYGTVKQERA